MNAKSQFVQSFAAKQRRQEYTVRLQHPADLDQRAGKIIDRMQRENARHQIESGIRERQKFLVSDDIRLSAFRIVSTSAQCCANFETLRSRDSDPAQMRNTD